MPERGESVRFGEADLSSCDREPIHIPGSVQPHGALVALADADLSVTHASESAAVVSGAGPTELFERGIDAALAPESVDELRAVVADPDLGEHPRYLTNARRASDGARVDASVHAFDGRFLVEVETDGGAASAGDNVYQGLKRTLDDLERATSVDDFSRCAAEHVKRITGFDRVMIYRFLEDGSGRVTAEAREERLEPFLGLHYPATDIPQQARELYRRSWLRIIPDIEYAPSPLVAAPGAGDRPVDMSYVTIRSVSPLHVEYLRNMGVAASMSLSILRDGRLWGLVACHHYSPKYVPHRMRVQCEILAHMLSLQMASKEQAEDHDYVARLTERRARLVEAIARAEGLAVSGVERETVARRWIDSGDLASIVESGGAAYTIGDHVETRGTAPDEGAVRELASWLVEGDVTSAARPGVFATNALGDRFAPAARYADVASGVVAALLSRERREIVMWFRPEVVRTVEWAGEPAKSVEVSADGARLSPRRSFAIWKETVRGTATPWKTCEVEAVAALRRAVVEVVAHNVETVDRLNRSLRLRVAELDSFAYAASHDLREPLRGIHNYARFLVEDYADALDEEAVSRLETLVRLAKRMESLIEALLRYSRVGRTEISTEPTDLEAVVASVLELLAHTIKERGARVVVHPLPTVDAHAPVVGEVFANLITNALKYNDAAEPLVEIGRDPERGAFFVRDNGIGIEKRHLKDVFRIFKRLHGRSEYGGGVGVGLTIVEKIVHWHGGTIWAESEPGEGTTFFFTLSEGHV